MTASETSTAMPGRVHRETFRRGSKTYSTSSRFFPAPVRRDVLALYGFVRVADDFVDRVPQDAAGFRGFLGRYEDASRDGGAAGDPIIGAFVELERRLAFPPEWARGFLHAMELDLTRRVYRSEEETLEYVWGSAEVIGLFMARILGLPEAAHAHARLLGRAMQYINFIRDIDEDHRLGRSYLSWNGPAGRLTEAAYARSHEAEFRRYIEHHVGRYVGWQRDAEAGYRYIPRRSLIPVKTAADMYLWTGEVIRRDPLVVFERKVKPSRARILRCALGNALFTTRGGTGA